MGTAIEIDSDVVARLCCEHGVERLRIFGTAAVGDFDPESSDVDFIVDFLSDRVDPFDDNFGLLEDLTDLVGRTVSAVRCGIPISESPR